MSYLILLVTSMSILAIALHLHNQFRQTVQIRDELKHARASKTLRGLHSLRKE